LFNKIPAAYFIDIYRPKLISTDLVFDRAAQVYSMQQQQQQQQQQN